MFFSGKSCSENRTGIKKKSEALTGTVGGGDDGSGVVQRSAAHVLLDDDVVADEGDLVGRLADGADQIRRKLQIKIFFC